MKRVVRVVDKVEGPGATKPDHGLAQQRDVGKTLLFTLQGQHRDRDMLRCAARSVDGFSAGWRFSPRPGRDDSSLGGRPVTALNPSGTRPRCSLVAEGRSYRWIARDLSLSKNTVAAVVGRARVETAPDISLRSE